MIPSIPMEHCTRQFDYLNKLDHIDPDVSPSMQVTKGAVGPQWQHPLFITSPYLGVDRVKFLQHPRHCSEYRLSQEKPSPHVRVHIHDIHELRVCLVLPILVRPTQHRVDEVAVDSKRGGLDLRYHRRAAQKKFQHQPSLGTAVEVYFVNEHGESAGLISIPK